VRQIYKYAVPLPGATSLISEIILPQHAALMSVGAQGEKIFVWALVDPEAERRGYYFKVVGTGWPLADDELDGYTFLGTVHMMPGLVWHVWVKR
jgi:hypothetical protein